MGKTPALSGHRLLSTSIPDPLAFPFGNCFILSIGIYELMNLVCWLVLFPNRRYVSMKTKHTQPGTRPLPCTPSSCCLLCFSTLVAPETRQCLAHSRCSASLSNDCLHE